MEINALLAAIAALRVGGPDVARAKAESAARAAAEGDFGLSATDIVRIAEKLPPDHSATIVLFENPWVRKFKEVARKHDGTVIDQRIIPSDTLGSLV